MWTALWPMGNHFGKVVSRTPAERLELQSEILSSEEIRPSGSACGGLGVRFFEVSYEFFEVRVPASISVRSNRFYGGIDRRAAGIPGCANRSHEIRERL